MTTVLTRLIQARSGIQLIKQYITDGNFTEDTFVNCKPGTTHYKDRAAILKEFEAVAENLNIPSTDPIRKSYPDFWKLTSKMYGMRSIIAHKYGVTEIDQSIVWAALTGPLQNEVGPTIDKLIEQVKAT